MKKVFEITDNEALELGNYLKERRESLGYSTNHIEIHTGIDKADLSRIENGKKKKINPLYLRELARVLKLNQIELFNKVGFIDDSYLPKNTLLDVDKTANDTVERKKDPLYKYIDKIDPEKRKIAEKMLKALIEDEN